MSTSNTMIFAGIIVGVAAIAGIMVYSTDNQQRNIPEDAVLAPAAMQGSFASPTGLGADLNKEKWHEDPFADEAAAVRAAYIGDK